MHFFYSLPTRNKWTDKNQVACLIRLNTLPSKAIPYLNHLFASRVLIPQKQLKVMRLQFWPTRVLHKGFTPVSSNPLSIQTSQSLFTLFNTWISYFIVGRSIRDLAFLESANDWAQTLVASIEVVREVKWLGVTNFNELLFVNYLFHLRT